MKRLACAVTLAGSALVLSACVASTDPATNVTATSATLIATASCSGGKPTACEWYWQWGTGGAYQNQSPIQGPVTVNASNAPLSYNVSGLVPNTTYRWEICGKGDNVSSFVCVGPSSFTTASYDGPVTSKHYAANDNFNGSIYGPGADGFNVADVSSNAEVKRLPSGVKGLAFIGTCNGADTTFAATIQSFIGDPNVFGFYLMDEPNPSSCPPANLKAESDYIHSNDPGTYTFIIEQDLSSSNHPTYQGGYNPANSDVDLYGLDPYPCRTENPQAAPCTYSWIGLAVTAAEQENIPLADIVPVYQAFGGGTLADDGGGQYQLPTAAQESEILSTWGSLVPTPVFDYVYSWGLQNSDTALSDAPALQPVYSARNG